MRRTVLFVAILLAVPLAVAAQQMQFNGLVFSSDGKSTTYTGSNDKCLDEKIEITDGKPALSVAKPAGYQKCIELICTFAMEKQNPAPCRCGIVVFTDASGELLKKPISKCDPEYAKQLSDGQFSATDLRGRAIQLAAQQYVQDIRPGTPLGNQQLAQALFNLDVPQTEANRIVANDPDKAYELVQKLAAGDTESAQQIATELHLNDSVSNKISMLRPTDLPDVLDGVVSQNQKQQLDNIRSAQTGFTDPNADLSGSRVVDAVEPFCGQIYGGCGNACSVRPDRLVCRTNNPGAIVCSPVAYRFGAIGCHPNNNTAIFPSVEHGAAAMGSLLTTSSRYFGTGNNSIFGAICNGYAASNCYQYAMTVARDVGISPMQTIDPKNTEMVAKIMTAMSKFEHGNGAIFTPAQLQGGLEAAFGTKQLPAGTPGYVPTYIAGGAQAAGYYSPFALGMGNTSVPTGIASIGSPAPLPYTSPQQTGQVAQQPNSQQPTQSPTPNTQQTPALPATPPQLAAATIIVQQRTVQKGDPVAVAWSSVGMREDIPCQVFSGSSFFAQGNAGSRVFDTKSVTASTTIVFTLKCTPQTGQKIEQAASVTIK